MTGCDDDEESASSAAAASCPTVEGVPGELTQLDAITCADAAEVATGYFSDGTVPESWSCGPYPGKLEAVQCFEGGCGPSAGSEVEHTPLEMFFVKLDDGETEIAYNNARRCPPGSGP
jgi:hypothetical protein